MLEANFNFGVSYTIEPIYDGQHGVSDRINLPTTIKSALRNQGPDGGEPEITFEAPVANSIMPSTTERASFKWLSVVRTLPSCDRVSRACVRMSFINH